MIKYIVPFIVSFLLSIIFIASTLHLAKKINWQDRISERHIHKKGTVLRTGGLALILAFNLAIILDKNLYISPELYGFMTASILLLIVGIWDDFREIEWKIQLFFQVAIAVFSFIMGIRIYYFANPLNNEIISLNSGIGILISAFFIITWIVLMINSMNWLDGIDGLSGGITLIGSLTIFILSLKPEVNQPPVAIISIILAGSILGFLIFNFNPSKILAGTSGSMFMGFSLSILAIFAGTKIATAILVMALPIIDFLWVIGERIRNNKSIFHPDRNHIHHKLLELGWSQRKITLLFYGITIAISIIALNTRVVGKSLTLIATALIMAIFLLLIDRKIKKLSYSRVK